MVNELKYFLNEYQMVNEFTQVDQEGSKLRLVIFHEEKSLLLRVFVSRVSLCIRSSCAIYPHMTEAV